MHNVKAARAILADHGGDVSALKEAEPWLFDTAPDKPKGGRTGLPNTGASGNEGRLVRHWRRLAGLEDGNEQ